MNMLAKSTSEQRYSDGEIHFLIQQAKDHPLGMDFFNEGAIESVAIMFKTDVFAVEIARELLNSENFDVLEAAHQQRKPETSFSREEFMSLPESAILCECWARDGLQSIPTVVSTEDKIEMINRVQEAGVKKLEVTSFSNPKLLPQFADSVEVMKGIKRYPDVSYVVLMPNEKGFDRFEECVKAGYGADEVILMISASESHNLLNFRMNHEDAMASHRRIIKRAQGLGVKVIGCSGTVFGCPVAGDVPIEDVKKIVKFYLDEGAQTIMLGDTTGMANPAGVRQRIGELIQAFPGVEFIAHFHDTRGTGIANSIAALELGLKYVDTSVGAIGGQPATGRGKYSLGFTGNTCSEDLVGVLEEMGVNTGIKMDIFIEAGKRAEEILDQPLRSNIILSGPVLHNPSEAVK